MLEEVFKIIWEQFQQTGSWIDRGTLHFATKGQYPIHSQPIQAVFEKYIDARENAHKARALGFTQVSVSV